MLKISGISSCGDSLYGQLLNLKRYGQVQNVTISRLIITNGTADSKSIQLIPTLEVIADTSNVYH